MYVAFLNITKEKKTGNGRCIREMYTTESKEKLCYLLNL